MAFDEILLPYYEQELAALRHLTRDFAERYPKIAGRLLLEGGQTADPHVERLLQGFAFVAARIHKRIDDEFPEVTEALLGILYPHLLAPVPSRSIVEFHVDGGPAKLTGRLAVPRGTPVFAPPVQGLQCEFRTCYPVEVWPIRVALAAFEPIQVSPFARGARDAVAALRIRLETLGGATFADLGIDRLRFHLHGEGAVTFTLYELLLNDVVRVEVAERPPEAPGRFEQGARFGPAAGTARAAGVRRLAAGRDAIRPVGFGLDEGLIDYELRSFLGYRLLHEYFAFPQKFLFVDIEGLAAATAGLGETAEIVVYLGENERPERMALLAQSIRAETLRLNATPIVNLFERNAEPIQLSHEKSEYSVVPDARRPLEMEVQAVRRVTRIGDRGTATDMTSYRPLYGIGRDADGTPPAAFWYVTRTPSMRPGDNGTDVALRLVDLDLKPESPTDDTISVDVLCSNRDLPEQLPFGGGSDAFEVAGNLPVARVACLVKPLPALRPPLAKGAHWRLISHLALNHLSLVEGGREALLEILSLYNLAGATATRREIGAILDVTSGPAVRRMGPAHRPAWCRGVGIAITLDESEFEGGGAYLFTSVLDRFLALHAATNAFTQLTVRTRQRAHPLVEWPPRWGEAVLA
ncbi:MAG: type VI secretion system baseplate subunit TssF [Alphaproteobacteria bacterium]